MFNSSGKQTQFSEYLANDSLNYRIDYTYDPKAQKAELSYFDKNLKPTIKKTYLYDAKGNNIEQQEFTREGKPDRRYVYKYDERGNMIEMIGYKADNTISSISTWKYDNKSNRTEYLLETPGYASSSRKWIYDEKGNNTEETWLDGRGNITFRFVRTYDAKGSIIEEKKYKGSDQYMSTVKWSYTYDSKGNWTKKVETTVDGVDYHIHERVIVYF